MNLWKIFGVSVRRTADPESKLYQAITVCNRVTDSGKTTEIIARANTIMASSPEEAYGLIHPLFVGSWPVTEGYQMHETVIEQVRDSFILARASALGWTRKGDGKTS